MGSSLVVLQIWKFFRANGGAVGKGQLLLLENEVQNYLYQIKQDKLHNPLEEQEMVQQTVNFNINTLDASGFDELLIKIKRNYYINN